MDSTKYVGMDVHKETISVAVMNSAGKVVMESILETKAATILQFTRGGNLLVTFEEGTWAAWLYDLLKPYVTQVTVCNPRKNALLKSGNKSDRIDARKLAELLRNGSLSSVYHGEKGLRTLKELSRTVLSWHRQGFRLFFAWISRRKRAGRPGVSSEVSQLIRKMAEANPLWLEAFPEDTAPRFLLRDRDKIYGCDFREHLRGLSIQEVLSAPASPWQSAFVERLIGSVRRDCLDHVIVLGEGHLRRILKSYLAYYHRSSTHLGLAKDTPEPRAVQPPEMGDIVQLPQVGGLHRYERRAA
jgi:transposase InsO family protein